MGRAHAKELLDQLEAVAERNDGNVTFSWPVRLRPEDVFGENPPGPYSFDQYMRGARSVLGTKVQPATSTNAKPGEAA
jgi:hypothetical protein